MPQTLTEGAYVSIKEREATAADTKSGLFYPHYSGLSGTLGKIYADGTAIIHVEESTLPAEIRQRHVSGSQAMRQKWLDGLSDEARNRLSAAEKKFALRYTILVSNDDLALANPPEHAVETGTQTRRLPQLRDVTDSTEPTRKSLADLEAEEARHLDSIAKKARE